MNRFTRILGALAALAAISCNANDIRTTVRYSILEDPGTTPADIKSLEAYALVFSGGICTYSGFWQELSELTGITAGTDDRVTVVAAESMENLGLPVLEPGEAASLHSEIRDFDLLRMYEERDPDGAMRLCRSVAVDYLTHNTDIQNFRQVRREILETLAR